MGSYYWFIRPPIGVLSLVNLLITLLITAPKP